MKQLNKKILSTFLASFIIGGMLSGCSDDLGVSSVSEERESGIYLYLPDIESAAEFSNTTRATSEIVGSEGSLTDLYLIIFKENNGNYDWVSCNDIKERGEINKSLNSTTTAYKSYKLPLNAGTYKFYLLGNLSHYTSQSFEDLKNIGDIENLALTFQGNLESGKLPMACLSAVKTTENGSVSPGTPVTISNEDIKSGKVIYADMSFLCTKVRYTVLFDNSSTGISKDFESKIVNFNPEVAVDNIFTKATVGSASSSTETTDYLSGKSDELTGRKYPSATYPATDRTSNDLEGSNADWTDNQRAWQGILYLPENNNDTHTKLTLSGACNASTASDAEKIYDISYPISLLPQEADGSKNLKRGNMYDLVISVKNYEAIDQTVTVSDWNLMSLTYALHGPYELEVEKTQIDVRAGKVTKFAYSSDVDVRCVSPVLTDDLFTDNNSFSPKAKGKDLYSFEIDGDSIAVTINSIPYEDLAKINTDAMKAKYNYFHIVAGNLQKKIICDELNLNPYFNVNPKEVIIDLREYITSGTYSVSIPVKFDTNITETAITLTDGNDLSGNADGAGGSYFKLKVEDGILLETSGTLTLDCKSMNSGCDFWNTNHEYTFQLKITYPTGTTDEEKTDGIRTVKITIKPYTTNYIIHFKCENSDKAWGSPHIYAYQCLEMPGEDSTYGGETVGYKDTGDNGYEAYLAALEYAFTTDISFNGWKNYGGSVDASKASSKKNGFVLFSSDYNFQPTAGSSTIYNYSNDLNNAQKQQTGWDDFCLRCSNNGYRKSGSTPRTWPGIVMQYEGNGWWKYILSGVATPGKTMIMFTDGHGNRQDDSYRFPGNAAVGIPLFDFPNNEGWFLFNGDTNDKNQNFVNYNPSPSVSVEPLIYRIYWPKAKGESCYMWRTSDNINLVGAWNDTDAYRDGIDGYFYFREFYTTKLGAMKYKYYPDGNMEWEGVDLSNLTAETTISGKTRKVRCFYVGGNNNSAGANVTAGKPSTSVNFMNRTDKQFQTDDLLLITWWNEYSGKYNLCNLFVQKDGNWVTFGTNDGWRDWEDEGRYYKTVRLSSTYNGWATFNFSAGTNSNSNSRGNVTIPVSYDNGNGSGARYTMTDRTYYQLW